MPSKTTKKTVKAKSAAKSAVDTPDLNKGHGLPIDYVRSSDKPVVRSKMVQQGTRCARCLGIYLTEGITPATLVGTTEQEIFLCYKDVTALGYDFKNEADIRVAICVRANDKVGQGHLVKESDAHPIEVRDANTGILEEVVYICDQHYKLAAEGPLEV